MRILRDAFLEEKPTNAIWQKAFMLEREKMAVQPEISPNKIILLEDLFDIVYTELQPTIQDYQARHDAVKFVNGLVRDRVSVGYIKKQFGLCHVRAFGSFTMDMFTPTSDLDISLNVEYGLENLSREEKIKILRRLTKCLYGLENGGGHVRGIQPVLKAKVPVVKFVHCKTGIECDVSAENSDGMIKSDILRILSSLDWRFRKLCFLVKAWANGNGINNSKDGTLNSLSITLLVAFHLQTRTPAILPPFSFFLEGLPSPATSDTISVVQKRVHNLQNFGRKNTESVVQLFHSLLMQLVSVKDLWQQGLCASTYEGTWTSTSKPGWMFVEDFTALTQNAARAVGDKGFYDIYKCLHETIMQFEKYFRSLCEANTLKSLLFRGPPVKTSVDRGNRGKRRLDDDIVHMVGNQQKLEKVLAEPLDVMHYMTDKTSIFSDMAGGVSLLRFQGEHPAKKIRSQEAVYEDRYGRHLPVPNSLLVRQADLASRSLTHRNLEPSFGDGLIHYDTPVNSRLQDRQSILANAVAPGGYRESTLMSQLYQQRLPGFLTTASRPYDESMGAVYSNLYGNPASSYASNDHKQYNGFLDSNLSHGMHHSQRYDEYAGGSTRYNNSGWR